MELTAGYHDPPEPTELAAIGPAVVDELRTALSTSIKNPSADNAQLYDSVCALVERMRDLAWTPEKCIIVLKQILRDESIIPAHKFPSARLTNIDRAAAVYERALLICIQAYFRDRPSL